MAYSRVDNACVMLSYNWHHQKLARKLVTHLRSAGFQVKHALEKPSDQVENMTPFCIVPLLSQAYEDSAAARKELLGAVAAGAKVVSVLVENTYTLHDWVKENCDETVLIHMPRNSLDVSQSDFKEIMTRLCVHVSAIREKGSSKQLLDDLSKVGMQELWSVEDPSYMAVTSSKTTKFLYVCVECNLDIQEVDLSRKQMSLAKLRLMRVFDEFCIFEDDISLCLCRVFEGIKHVFFCIHGDADAIDTIIRTGDDFLQNLRSEDKVALISYSDFRDRIFLGQNTKTTEDSFGPISNTKKHNLVLSCLFGMPVRSTEIEVKADISLEEVIDMARKWLTVTKECAVILFVWDGRKFLKAARTFEDFWKHGHCVGDSVTLQVLLEPTYAKPPVLQRYSFAPSSPLQWIHFAALQEPFMFSVECRVAAETEGLNLIGPVKYLEKLEAHHKNGQLENYCGTQISLKRRAVVKPTTVPYGDIDGQTSGTRDREDRKYSTDERHKRLRRQIRAIENNLGVIRPGVSLKSATPGTPRMLRNKFILKGVTEVQKESKEKAQASQTKLRHQVRQSSQHFANNPKLGTKFVFPPVGESATVGSQSQPQPQQHHRHHQPPTPSSSDLVDTNSIPSTLHMDSLTGANGPPNSPISIRRNINNKSSVKFRKDINAMVQGLRSKNSQSRLKRLKKPRRDRRRGSGNVAEAISTYRESLTSVSSLSTADTDDDHELDLLPTGNVFDGDDVQFGAELSPFTNRLYSRLSRGGDGTILAADLKSELLSTAFPFTANELQVMFEGIDLHDENIVSKDEFHKLCCFGYFGKVLPDKDSSEA